MTKIKKFSTLILALGILAFGSALAAAGAGNQPALPDEIAAALDGDAVIVFYDAEGNVVWSSDSEQTFDPALLERVAEVVISDANGNVVEDLPVITGPKDKPVIVVDDYYFGLGTLLKEAGVTGNAPKNGSGRQKQDKEQHHYQAEHKNHKNKQNKEEDQKKEHQQEEHAKKGSSNGHQDESSDKGHKGEGNDKGHQGESGGKGSHQDGHKGSGHKNHK